MILLSVNSKRIFNNFDENHGISPVFFLYPKNYRVILENSSESSEMRIWNFELETSNRQWIETMTLVWIIIHFTFSGYMDVNGAEIHQRFREAMPSKVIEYKTKSLW